MRASSGKGSESKARLRRSSLCMCMQCCMCEEEIVSIASIQASCLRCHACVAGHATPITATDINPRSRFSPARSLERSNAAIKGMDTYHHDRAHSINIKHHPPARLLCPSKRNVVPQLPKTVPFPTLNLSPSRSAVQPPASGIALRSTASPLRPEKNSCKFVCAALAAKRSEVDWKR